MMKSKVVATIECCDKKCPYFLEAIILSEYFCLLKAEGGHLKKITLDDRGERQGSLYGAPIYNGNGKPFPKWCPLPSTHIHN